MPLCLMTFGQSFPARSSLAVRLPWIKWRIAIPILLLYPSDILYYYGHGFNFAADAWSSPWFYRLTLPWFYRSTLCLSLLARARACAACRCLRPANVVDGS